MVIDLLPIINAQGERIPVKGEISGSGIIVGGEVTLTKPAQVSGFILNIGNTLELNIDIEAEIKARCDRCGKDITKTISFTSADELRRTGDELEGINAQGFEGVYFTGNSIDITEMVYNTIFMNLPMKMLCREDCKGLCPHCGTDLNAEQCNCGDNDTDPRFDILNNIAGNNEEV